MIDDREPRSGPVNMALDETLLLGSAGSPPLLRFYRWTVPTVSFGYFEPVGDARRLAGGREIVRRMTGGGLVEHGEDLTYTLVVPRPEPLVNLRSADAYRLIHGAVALALARVGVAVRSHLDPGEPQPALDGNACFQRPVPYDLVADGGKIAGGAQRRTRAGLLHQGSILLAGAVDAGWTEAFRAVLPTVLARAHEVHALTFAELAGADALAAARYASTAWTDRN